jgi:hypothetical protein
MKGFWSGGIDSLTPAAKTLKQSAEASQSIKSNLGARPPSLGQHHPLKNPRASHPWILESPEGPIPSFRIHEGEPGSVRRGFSRAAVDRAGLFS